MTNTFRIYGNDEASREDTFDVLAHDFHFDDTTGMLVFVDPEGGVVAEYAFNPVTSVRQIHPHNRITVYGISPRCNPRYRPKPKTFRVEPGFAGTLPEVTVEADDYRYHKESGQIVFSWYYDGEAARVPFEKGTRVVDVSGQNPEYLMDDAHANPLSPFHYTFYVGECPREGKTPEELDRAQEAQARTPGGKKTVVAETFGYHEREDRIVFYNTWGERAGELPFGPDTWVRREDVDGTILPEVRENPKAKA